MTSIITSITTTTIIINNIRDLANRNVLVASDSSENYTLKISDFGLSKRLEQTEYGRTKDETIPIVSSAIESLRDPKNTQYRFAK